jgi:thioester reductase-like protein
LTILLSGGTGLVGGEVLGTLLRRGNHVVALARAMDHAGATQRIHARLAQSGYCQTQAPQHLRCVPGDITLPNWGLETMDCPNVDLVVHCAGETSFRHDAGSWQVNVEGIRRLIELYSVRRLSCPVFFVSTAAVCTSPGHSILPESSDFAGYTNPYIASKRAAETLLVSSGIDAVILRPSIVLSRGIQDSRLAKSILWVVPVMWRIGSVPVDPCWRLDIVPVSFVSEAIVQLIERPRLCQRLYHISAGEAASVTCAEMTSAIQSVGYAQLRLHGAGTWQHLPPANGFQRLAKAVEYYLPFFNADVVYNNSRLHEECGGTLPRCEPATGYVHTLLKQFDETAAIEESHRP